MHERCHTCGRETLPLPYTCNYCGKNFCAEHRLPEKHRCENITKVGETSRTPTTGQLLEEIADFEKAWKKGTPKSPLGKLMEKLRRRFSWRLR